MSDTRLIVADSIEDISRADWEMLTAADVYGQFGFLQAAEMTFRYGNTPRYFLLHEDDEPAAAAVAYGAGRDRSSGLLEELLFGRAASLAARLGSTPRKALYFGSPIGHGRPVFWNRECSADEAARRIRLFITEIASQPSFCGFTFAFGRVLEEETVLIEVLRELGYLETRHWPISYMDLEWDTFEEYAASLSSRGKNQPTKIRREAVAPEKMGVTIERLVEFDSQSPEIYFLFEQTLRKHSADTPVVGPEFIEALASHHSAHTVMTVAQSGNAREMLGCALLLVADGVASGSLIGIVDSKLNREAFTYFNLSIYAPIRYCIKNGIDRIYFGGGLRHMKRRRGCYDMNAYIFMRPAGRFTTLLWRAWFAFHQFWVRGKSRRDAR